MSKPKIVVVGDEIGEGVPTSISAKSAIMKIDSKKDLFRLRQSCNIAVGVLSLAPCYVRKKQVRDKGVPSSYHSKWWSVFVEWWLHHYSPLPCMSKLHYADPRPRQKVEVLHLFRCVAHTHTYIYIVEIFDSGLNMGPDKWGCFNIFPRVNTGDPQSTKAKTYFRKNAPKLFISGSMGLGLEETLPLQTLQL